MIIDDILIQHVAVMEFLFCLEWKGRQGAFNSTSGYPSGTDIMMSILFLEKKYRQPKTGGILLSGFWPLLLAP